MYRCIPLCVCVCVWMTEWIGRNSAFQYRFTHRSCATLFVCEWMNTLVIARRNNTEIELTLCFINYCSVVHPNITVSMRTWKCDLQMPQLKHTYHRTRSARIALCLCGENVVWSIRLYSADIECRLFSGQFVFSFVSVIQQMVKIT